MSLVWIAVLGLLIWAIVAAVRHPAESGGSSNSALDVLKRRYATGEIDREEYEEKKKDLAWNRTFSTKNQRGNDR